MSAKHHQRTRAQKLARRDLGRVARVLVPKGVKIVLGKVIHASPWVSGKKEAERGARLSMEADHGAHGFLRSAPIVVQMSKRAFYEMSL